MTKKISFFSYKGGSGRSLSLANVGIYLSMSGTSVGAIELDIGAPGLLEILGIKNLPEYSSVDLLRNPDPVNIVKSVVNVNEALGIRTKSNHSLYLIPAKKRDADKIGTVNWSADGLAGFDEHIMTQFQKLYDLDFILIDCKSGIGMDSLSGILLGESTMIFTRLDKQSIAGTAYWINTLKENSEKIPFTVVVTGYHGERADIALDRLQDEISSDIKYKIPYDEMLSLEEEIVVRTRAQNDPVRVAYEKLAREIFLDGKE